MSVRMTEFHKRLRPGLYLTATQKLMKGIWPWTEGPRAKLPKHYKVRYLDTYMKEPKPVNFAPVADRFADERSKGNIPIPIRFPKVADEGLWGGEGIVEGLYRSKNNPKKARDVWIWKPELEKSLCYSEILEKWMEVTVTRRTLDQIDECKGFDHYILATHEVDLKSKLGMKLKREMLFALHGKTFSKDEPEKQKQLLLKYEKYLIPFNEIEWLGLDINEAEYKLLQKEEVERLDTTVPLKQVFMAGLVQQLKDGTYKEDELPGDIKHLSAMGKIKSYIPFRKKKDA